MYWLSSQVKRDPDRRWALPDRIFFGRGACHILAGMYLKLVPLEGFHAERIVPAEGFAGTHVFVTNGEIAFDFHGYCLRSSLFRQHFSGWRKRYPDWAGIVERVRFDLLDTNELNARKMLGPDQYKHDAAIRAERYLSRINHEAAYAKAVAKQVANSGAQQAARG